MARACIRCFFILVILLTASRSIASAQSKADGLSPVAASIGSLPRLALAPTPLLARHSETLSAPPHYEKHWYGWQTLIVDAASIALAFGGGIAEIEPLFWTGIVGVVSGSPIVHFAHGNAGVGFASMGVRAGLLFIVIMVTVILALDALGDDSSNGDDLVAAEIVALSAAIGASALDAAVFAYDRVLVGGQALLRPWYDARSGSAGLRVAGSF